MKSKWINWKFENFEEWKNKENTEIALDNNMIVIYDGEHVYEWLTLDDIKDDLKQLEDYHYESER